MDLQELTETATRVSPNDVVARVIGIMSKGQVKVAVVIRDRKVLGIIDEAAVARSRGGHDREGAALLARDIMMKPVPSTPATTPVIDAARDMRAKRFQYLALEDDNGDFVGLVTLRRVLFEVLDELDLKVDNLERELMADGPGG